MSNERVILNEVTYLQTLEDLYLLSQQDEVRDDRTGTGTFSLFGHQLKYDISNNTLPMLSTKFVSFKTIAHELIWILSGTKSIKYLKDNGVKIWDDWLMTDTQILDDEGNLIDGISSSIYGESWREWEDTRIIDVMQLGDLSDTDIDGYPNARYMLLDPITGTQKYPITREIDQIDRVLWQIKNKPDSRRIILNGWNAVRTGDVKLPPCHTLAQWYVKEGKLSCHLYMRSNDYFLGNPYNIVQYSLLTHIFATLTGLESDELIVSFGDIHIYSNHLEAVKEQLDRDIVEDNHPRVIIDPNIDPTLKDIHIDQFELVGYKHQSSIKAPIAV